MGRVVRSEEMRSGNTGLWQPGSPHNADNTRKELSVLEKEGNISVSQLIL